MSGTVQCPNCKQPVTSDSDFCIFCGTKLPATPFPVPSPIYEKAIMRCRNGHEFDDAGLRFCPTCGLPFEDLSAPVSNWLCSCGHSNPADNVFCEGCGRSKDPTPKPPTPMPPTSMPPIPHPDIMYLPTDDDIRPKKSQNRV